jgi:hypothetical protein
MRGVPQLEITGIHLFQRGMGTGMVQYSAAGSLRMALNSPFFLSPNPPQEEWGIKGVERGF